MDHSSIQTFSLLRPTVLVLVLIQIIILYGGAPRRGIIVSKTMIMGCISASCVGDVGKIE